MGNKPVREGQVPHNSTFEKCLKQTLSQNQKVECQHLEVERNNGLPFNPHEINQLCPSTKYSFTSNIHQYCTVHLNFVKW